LSGSEPPAGGDHEWNATAPANAGSRSIFRWVRLFLGLVILAFVFVRLDLGAVAAVLRKPVWWGVILACIAHSLATFLFAVRWRDLLLAVGVDRRVRDLAALVLVGFFYNMFLPTAIGGDVFRGYHVSRSDESLTTSYVVLIVERLLGLLTLAAVVALGAGYELAVGGSPLSAQVLGILVVAGTGAVVVGIGMLFWPWWPAPLAWLSRRGRRHERVASAVRSGLEIFRRPNTPRARIMVISLVRQFAAILFYYGSAVAVGLDVGVVAFFLVVPASVVVSMLPVTINGLGLREGTLAGLLVLYGGDPGRVGAFLVISLFLATVFSLIGGVVHLLYRTPRERGGNSATPAT
jgi:uncharacterized membrane protein YbhN (UPF0104 family)